MDTLPAAEHSWLMKSKHGESTSERLLLSVIDDDEMLRESLPELLREFGFAADKANSLAIPYRRISAETVGHIRDGPNLSRGHELGFGINRTTASSSIVDTQPGLSISLVLGRPFGTDESAWHWRGNSVHRYNLWNGPGPVRCVVQRMEWATCAAISCHSYPKPKRADNG